MKFLFVEEAQNLGGARIATINTAALLQKEGNEVIILDIWGTCRPFYERCYQKGIPIDTLKKTDKPIVLSEGSVLVRAFKTISFLYKLISINTRLKSYIQNYTPDFICLSSRRIYYYLIGTPNNKTIYFQHEWGLKKQFTKLNAFFLKKRTRGIICVSEATRQALYNNGFKDLSSLYVCHTGISMPLLTGKVRKDERFTILHSSGFIKSKGQLISIEIARVLKSLSFDFKLILMGIIYNNEESRNFYKSLHEIVERYGLTDNVQFVVAPENVFDYVSVCDILIHPSYTEGYGLVIAEAQLLGKPVIANPVGGVIDLIANGFTGFLANFNDVEDYVRIIMNLYNNHDLYEFIRRNAIGFISRTITLEEQKEQLLRVFNKINDENKNAVN